MTNTAITKPATMDGQISFGIADEAIAKMTADFMPLTIKGIDDKEGADKCHKARMLCVKGRTDIDKKRKDLNSEAKKWIDTVNGEAKRLTGLLAPVEKHLVDEESRIKAEIAAERTRKWREEEERKRVEEAAAEAERQRKIAEENARLAEQRAELERQRAEAAEAQRKAEAELAAQRAAIEESRRSIQEAQAKIDAARAAAEAERQRLADAEAARLRKIEEDAKPKPVEVAMPTRPIPVTHGIGGPQIGTADNFRRNDSGMVADVVTSIPAVRTTTPAPNAVEPSPFLHEDAAKLQAVAACIRGIDIPQMATGEGLYASMQVSAILDRASAEVRDIALSLAPTANVLPPANYDSDGNEMEDDSGAPF